MFDLIIIGGGPAGVAAGVYAARKKMKTLLIAGELAGQSVVSADIHNWIGEPSISGLDLTEKLEKHLRSYEGRGLDIKLDWVKSVSKLGPVFQVKTPSETFQTKTILLASGSKRKRLGVKGEDEFDGKGVAWCSICDAPLFADVPVAVVGGGNVALEAVLDLEKYASKVYLLVRGNTLKGDPITQDKISKLSKVEMIYNSVVEEIYGKDMVTGLRCKIGTNSEIKELPLGGVFIEIGAVPNSDLVKGLVKLNFYNEIEIDHQTQASSLPGIWAAGDVSNCLYKQNNISAGDGIRAVLNIYDFLHR